MAKNVSDGDILSTCPSLALVGPGINSPWDGESFLPYTDRQRATTTMAPKVLWTPDFLWTTFFVFCVVFWEPGSKSLVGQLLYFLLHFGMMAAKVLWKPFEFLNPFLFVSHLCFFLQFCSMVQVMFLLQFCKPTLYIGSFAFGAFFVPSFNACFLSNANHRLAETNISWLLPYLFLFCCHLYCCFRQYNLIQIQAAVMLYHIFGKGVFTS